MLSRQPRWVCEYKQAYTSTLSSHVLNVFLGRLQFVLGHECMESTEHLLSMET